MNSNETRSLAVEKVLSASKRGVREVIVLDGRKHLEWCKAYEQNGISSVRHVTFGEFDRTVPLEKSGNEGVRIIHVTKGVPANSLSEAEQNVSLLASNADIVVFSPVPASEQNVQDLLISWPSFWAMLFLAKGFILRDIIRPVVWDKVYDDWDTLQSTIVFTNSALDHDWVASENENSNLVIDYVHPTTLEVSLKRQLALQTSAGLAVSPNTSSFKDSTSIEGMGSSIHIAFPKRYSKKSYEKKLFQESRRWWQVALLTPWKVSYWSDLWRLQRRLKRKMKTG